MEDKTVILVTGMSGAGKSQTMAIFENMQYYCIDNYPVALLNELGDYIKSDQFSQNKIALAIPLNDAMDAIRILHNIDWIQLTILFLDCEDNIIIKRYKQTRRSHPMMINHQASTLTEAIELERKVFDNLKSQANQIVDTTLLKPKNLSDVLESMFHTDDKQIFRVSFVSFGYKYGVPKDADLLLDVRFLPNPFYEEDLRSKTGNDVEVYNYVMEKEETKEFIKKTLVYYDYLLDQYEKEGKMQVIIGIGCTGGQHRSVTITNYLAEHYKSTYAVYKWHRDAQH